MEPRARRTRGFAGGGGGGRRAGAGRRQAKEKVKCLKFPKRSSDLNPLEYGFWSMINARLRGQEPKFPPSKRESRAAFIKRLKRTIMRTPSATLEPLVKSMKRRCAALKAASRVRSY